MPAKFELKQARNKKVFFNLVAPNGEVVLTSQMYTNKKSARKGIASVQANASAASQFDQRQDKKGEHYFVLTARNNQVIGNSEMYSSKAAMEKGVKAVMKSGAKAGVVDHTV